MHYAHQVLDSQCRKDWSNAHGRATYGSDNEGDTVHKVGVKHKCKCGSTTHSCPTYGDCTLNKKRRVDVPDLLHDDLAPSELTDSDTPDIKEGEPGKRNYVQRVTNY